MWSSVKRREFLLYGLSGGISGLLMGAVFHVLKYFTGIAAMKRPMRPPGALEEPLFLAKCTRCNLCLSSCPAGLLQPLNFAADISAGTPEVVFTGTDGRIFYCEKDCVKCPQVCPTGAIQNFTKETKQNYKIGLAVFDFGHCRLYEDIECSICERECPYEAISYVWSEKKYRKVVVIDKEKCTGCGRCAATCPVCIENKTNKKPKPLRLVSVLA